MINIIERVNAIKNKVDRRNFIRRALNDVLDELDELKAERQSIMANALTCPPDEWVNEQKVRLEWLDSTIDNLNAVFVSWAADFVDTRPKK